jgi:hypothetical protein
VGKRGKSVPTIQQIIDRLIDELMRGWALRATGATICLATRSPSRAPGEF